MKVLPTTEFEGKDAPVPGRRRWAPALIEALAVASSPIVLFFVMRLRPMARMGIPDPGMHTIFIVDPRDVFQRYSHVYTVEMFREGARVGFLLPARLAYLLFGGLGGFFVTRYFLALVAIVPAYILLRRLYGVAAGAIGIIVVLSCPVIVTAWGTDYPDSAAVSYLCGGLACLAMPSGDRRRWIWVALAGALFTLAVWSLATSAPLVVVTLVVYALLAFFRDRRNLLRDVGVLAAVAVAVTVLAIPASALLLGRANFISTTISSAAYYTKASNVALYHSKSWSWAPYRDYILVLPAVVAAWIVVFARRFKDASTAVLVVGLSCAGQVLVAACLQFFGSIQILEQHYLSSILWGSVSLTVSVTLAEIARPLLQDRAMRWLPAGLLVVAPLLYETYPFVPSFVWWPVGLLLVGLVVAAAAAGGKLRSVSLRAGTVVGTSVVLLVIVGSVLVLTVAPIRPHKLQPGVSRYDQSTGYNLALGGTAAKLVGHYQISTELPGFVGQATYSGEQLMTWHPYAQGGVLQGELGLYHDGFNQIPDFPLLTVKARRVLEARRPAEMLFLSTTGHDFDVALRSLAPYKPVLIRTRILRSPPAVVHAWLLVLRSFYTS